MDLGTPPSLPPVGSSRAAENSLPGHAPLLSQCSPKENPAIFLSFPDSRFSNIQAGGRLRLDLLDLLSLFRSRSCRVRSGSNGFSAMASGCIQSPRDSWGLTSS